MHIVRLLFLLVVPLLGLACAAAPPGEQGERLRVMTFNIWVGGEGGRQPLERTADAIRAAEADVVGFQEVSARERNGARPDNGREVADMLRWNYLKQPGTSAAIATRHRIVEATPGGHGALIETAGGRRFLFFNVHLNHAPYQPYQLLGIPYHNGRFIETAQEAIAEAELARGDEVAALIRDIQSAAERHPEAPIFVTGDFNEPSHLDWTPEAAAAGRTPLAVEWPSTRALANLGFVDAFRVKHPDAVATPGHTWTPTTRIDDPGDRHDRIDFVLARLGDPEQSAAVIEAAEVVGESAERANIVVSPWPSDHRAVVVTVRL